MKKIESIIRTSRLEKVIEALSNYGVKGMTVTNVIGYGLQQGRKESYRGSEYTVNLLPKIKIEIVAANETVEQIVSLIRQEAKTGEIGDGKIFIYEIADAIRIRTGESGKSAI